MSYIQNTSKEIIEPIVFENSRVTLAPGEVTEVPEDDLENILGHFAGLKEVKGPEGEEVKPKAKPRTKAKGK